MSTPFDRDRGALHLRMVAPEGGTVFVGRAERARPFKLPDACEAALDHAQDLVAVGKNCYVTPAVFERRDGTLKRDLAHVVGAALAWCDVDGWDDSRDARFHKLRAALPGGALFRVETSPGRFHIYVRLSGLADAETVRRLNDRLVDVFAGDPAPAHAAAWMRLAGTVHQPKPKDTSDPQRNVPRLVRFVERPVTTRSPSTLSAPRWTNSTTQTPTQRRKRGRL
jgi:hypothetical protein